MLLALKTRVNFTGPDDFVFVSDFRFRGSRHVLVRIYYCVPQYRGGLGSPLAAI